jgi:hypothetical protein
MRGALMSLPVLLLFGLKIPIVGRNDPVANMADAKVHLRLWRPRCLRKKSVRPEALRPRLSASLPLALEGIFDNGTLISQAAESLSGDTAYDDRYSAREGLGLCRTEMR